MTRHRATADLTIAGTPIASRLSARFGELTALVIARLLAEIPFYGRLPAEEIRGDVTDIVKHSLRVFGSVVRGRAPATHADLEPLRRSAQRRAEEGVPLDAILTAYHLGTRIVWTELVADARPEDLPDVLEGHTRVLGLLSQMTATVSADYVETQRTLLGHEHDARRALISALLAGTPLDEPARHAGLRLPAGYVVLVLAIDQHPDESSATVSASVAGHRKVRRIQAEFDRQWSEPVLSVLDATGGIALLPSGDEPGFAPIGSLLTDAARSAGADITAGAEPAAPTAVPAAVELAGEVLSLVRSSGFPPGLYRLADVLLEYQLTRPSPARAQLAALLEPLAGSPELLHTLQVYVRHERNRRRTASELHIHPGTVDYRVHRIATLTGLNPTRPTDLHYLRAALAARLEVRLNGGDGRSAP